ncbi:FkbM family methyltransferase [Pelagibacteraceae bacterium]|nr:FkbM family methyltransferase [Pelagibacteraceae bacterium]
MEKLNFLNLILIMLKFLTKIPLLKRLLPSIIRRLCVLLKIDFFTIKYQQIFLRLKITDAVDRHILFRGEYENEQIEYLFDMIKKYQISVFIDIGSNIGLYSILMEENFPRLKIYAFEPHPDAFARLKVNLELNKSQNIECFNLALSNENRKSFLNIGNNHIKDFKNFQSGGAKVNDFGSIPINLSTGDSIFNNQNDIISIKIDVEGHENLVINGMHNLLNNNKVLIQIEIHLENFIKTHEILSVLNYHQIKKIGQHDYYYKNF